MCVSLRFSYLKDAFKASGVSEDQSVSLYLCLFSWSSASWDSATGQMRIFYLPGMSCESICATSLRLISRELHQIFTQICSILTCDPEDRHSHRRTNTARKRMCFTSMHLFDPFWFWSIWVSRSSICRVCRAVNVCPQDDACDSHWVWRSALPVSTCPVWDTER